MQQQSNINFGGLILACILCHAMASLVMSAYYASGAPLEYTEPIRWHQLLTGLERMNASAVKSALRVSDLVFFAATFLGLALIFSTRNQVRSIPRFLFFIFQPVLFCRGWVGLVLLIAFPFEARKLDGEWLEEQSPTLMSLGVWIAVSMLIAFSSLKRPAGRSENLSSNLSSG